MYYCYRCILPHEVLIWRMAIYCVNIICIIFWYLFDGLYTNNFGRVLFAFLVIKYVYQLPLRIECSACELVNRNGQIEWDLGYANLVIGLKCYLSKHPFCSPCLLWLAQTSKSTNIIAYSMIMIIIVVIIVIMIIIVIL